MSNSNIRKALNKVTETRDIVLSNGVIKRAVSVYQNHFDGVPAILIADENTFSVCGEEIYQQLRAANLTSIDPIVFPGSPMLYANYDNVLLLEEKLRSTIGVPVVVGSGTLNDLTKLASHHLGREYMVVCTAASMDGYTASGASISRDGFKQTFACPAPRIVLADLDVLMKAPYKMTASGYGDLIAKNVAGADWLMAEAMGIEPVDKTAWDMVQGSLLNSIENPLLLRTKDHVIYQRFVEGLMLSGLTLQYYKGSRPASGAEHLMSHLWEMHEVAHGVYSHGLKVGLATIASAALYEKVLERDFQKLDVEKTVKDYPSRDQINEEIKRIHSNPQVIESTISQCMAKYPDRDVLLQRLSVLKENWQAIKARLLVQLIPASKMRQMLTDAGCITHPNQMEKSLDDLKTAYRQARLIRSRYTVLDLAAETGCMEECLDELFSPGGFWS